jgi:hypothetical protein
VLKNSPAMEIAFVSSQLPKFVVILPVKYMGLGVNTALLYPWHGIARLP